jgi:hypothetical protein
MRAVRAVLFSLFAASSLAFTACVSPFPVGDELGEIPDFNGAPAGQPIDFKRLAGQIDGLEKQIDKLGSIVPQHADVWGQSRLMMHRQEFEREMQKDVVKFGFTIQAAIATSDQAFLANAFGLQAAVGSAQGMKGPDVTSFVSSGNDVIARDKLLSAATFSPLANNKLAIEQTLLEDQKRRFLDHLQELRRINEGDDTTDAPGYTLNLVSIPISVLTGDCTQVGYGGECTITAAPHLTDDLLPTTFRDLVINDVVDLLGLQVTKVMEAVIDEKTLAPAIAYALFLNEAEYLGAQGLDMATASKTAAPADTTVIEKIQRLLNNPVQPIGISPRPGKRRPIAPSEIPSFIGIDRILTVALTLARQINPNHQACNEKLFYLDVQAALRQELTAAYDFLSTEENQRLWSLCTPALVEAVRSRNQQAFLSILNAFVLALGPSPQAQTQTNSTAPKGVEPGTRDRAANADNGGGAPKENDAKKADASDNSSSPRLPVSAITRALAWIILLDAALLNDRFLEDMRDTHAAKGCACLPPGWVPLYLPNPPPEARQLFNDYVRCRWPLHIFALDPETEDQNVADSYRLRREMQLALSLAFTSGQVSASNFTRYVRRIEQDIDTISLNRTMIGFSHGDNTFG